MAVSRNPRRTPSEEAAPHLPADTDSSLPHWQRETGFTDPNDVVNWLREGASRVNEGKPLATNSTDILRAAREGRHHDEVI